MRSIVFAVLALAALALAVEQPPIGINFAGENVFTLSASSKRLGAGPSDNPSTNVDDAWASILQQPRAVVFLDSAWSTDSAVFFSEFQQLQQQLGHPEIPFYVLTHGRLAPFSAAFNGWWDVQVATSSGKIPQLKDLPLWRAMVLFLEDGKIIRAIQNAHYEGGVACLVRTANYAYGIGSTSVEGCPVAFDADREAQLFSRRSGILTAERKAARETRQGRNFV